MNSDEQNGGLFEEKSQAEQKTEINIPGSSEFEREQERRIADGTRSCGLFLQREREKLGMTPQEVYAAVKIKPERIIALEQEDFDSLPEAIYIAAYIKRLCDFYHVKSSIQQDLLESLDLHKTVEVPEDFSKTLKGYCVDEENAKRERRMIFGAIIVLVVVLVLIGVGITLAVIHLNAPEKQSLSDPSVVEETLLKLQNTPKLRMTEL